MSDLAVTIECGMCSWTTFVDDAESGQSLVGTAAEQLARHEGQTGCHNSPRRDKIGASVTLWEVVAE